MVLKPGLATNTEIISNLKFLRKILFCLIQLPVYTFSNSDSKIFLCFSKLFADMKNVSWCKPEQTIMQVRRNVNIRNTCLIYGEVMSLISPLERVVIVPINAETFPSSNGFIIS
jgi:hypothetical protein